jgi:hypothetical protein
MEKFYGVNANKEEKTLLSAKNVHASANAARIQTASSERNLKTIKEKRSAGPVLGKVSSNLG